MPTTLVPIIKKPLLTMKKLLNYHLFMIRLTIIWLFATTYSIISTVLSNPFTKHYKLHQRMLNISNLKSISRKSLIQLEN